MSRRGRRQPVAAAATATASPFVNDAGSPFVNDATPLGMSATTSGEPEPSLIEQEEMVDRPVPQTPTARRLVNEFQDLGWVEDFIAIEQEAQALARPDQRAIGVLYRVVDSYRNVEKQRRPAWVAEAEALVDEDQKKRA